MQKSRQSFGVLLLQMTFLCLPAHADELQDMMSAIGSADFHSAVSSGESYLKLHPSSPDAHFYLAKSFMGLKQGTQAEEHLRACMALAPAGSEMQANCIAALKEISQSNLKSGNLGAALSGNAGSSSLTAPAANSYSGTQHFNRSENSRTARQVSNQALSGASRVQNYGVLKKPAAAGQANLSKGNSSQGSSAAARNNSTKN